MNIIKKFAKYKKKEWNRFKNDENGFIGMLIIGVAVFFIGGSFFLWRLQEALWSLVVCVFLLMIPLIALVLVWKYIPGGKGGIIRTGRAVGGAGVRVVERGAGVVKRRV